MNEELKVLKTAELCGHQFNVYGTPDQPLFIASDVADLLSLSNVSDMVKRVDSEELTKLNLGGKRGETWFLTEDGLYEVLMQSRKAIAKQFKKGVKAILKEIRKTGGYIATTAEETAEEIMAKALRIADETLKRKDQMLQMAQSTIQEQEKEIKEMAPMAEYSKGVLQSDSTYTLTQVSKDLNFRSVYAFLAWAQGEKSGQWMPTKKVSGRGFFTTRTAKFTKKDGTVGSSISTVVTEPGRAFLHNLLSKKGGAK